MDEFLLRFGPADFTGVDPGRFDFGFLVHLWAVLAYIAGFGWCSCGIAGLYITDGTKALPRLGVLKTCIGGFKPAVLRSGYGFWGWCFVRHRAAYGW